MSADRGELIVGGALVVVGLFGVVWLFAIWPSPATTTPQCTLPPPEKRTQSEFACRPRADIAKAMGLEHIEIYLCGRFVP